MDEVDSKLISALRRDGRASISDLAGLLGVTRTTVRTRLARLEQDGTITGYTVLTRADEARAPVRGLMMLGIEGRGTEKVISRLQGLREVEMVYTTNGHWDLIAVIGTDTLEHLDETLFVIRRLEGVTRSETSLLLSSRRAGRRR